MRATVRFEVVVLANIRPMVGLITPMHGYMGGGGRQTMIAPPRHQTSYEDEAESLRAYHRALLGGSPDEQPERYAASSPITYVDRVQAPVLILAGENDTRCPLRQIEKYVGRLAEHGHPYEVYTYDAIRGSLVVAERIAQMSLQLEFARKHLRH